MGDSFSDLSTEKFRLKMKPFAEQIYKALIPNSTIQDLREDGVKVHILDKEFGVDSLWCFPSGQWLSIQEKYRKHNALRYGDFTQEYKNGAGTIYESDGEWFKLGAHLYFYGWANESETGFEKWIILNIAKYKMLVNKLGGIDKIGKLCNNYKHGRASFYSIKLETINPAIIMKSENMELLLIQRNHEKAA